MHSNGKPGTAMVTGASSGIGAAYAQRLARRGYDLILVARRENMLRQRAEQLEKMHHVHVDVVKADLAGPKALRLVEERIAVEEHLAMLVNCAGIGGLGDFSEMARDGIRRMIDVNMTAVTLLTHAVLPGMLNKGSGIIINIASGLAYARMAGAAVYSGTKAYVVQFTRVLHEEVGASGIRLQALIPGLTRTGLGPGKDTSFFDRFPPELVMEPGDLVDASLRGLELGELVCIPGLDDAEKWLEADAAMREIGDSVSSRMPAMRYR